MQVSIVVKSAFLPMCGVETHWELFLVLGVMGPISKPMTWICAVTTYFGKKLIVIGMILTDQFWHMDNTVVGPSSNASCPGIHGHLKQMKELNGILSGKPVKTTQLKFGN